MAMTGFNFSEDEIYVIAQRAYELALQGAHDDAAVLLEGLIAINSNDGYAAATLAAVRLKQGRAADAVELLEQRRREEPRDAKAGLLLVETYVDLGRLADADRLARELKTFGIEAPERLRLRLLAARQSSGVPRIKE